MQREVAAMQPRRLPRPEGTKHKATCAALAICPASCDTDGMLMTITCTATDATDLGFLLHKNPASVFERDVNFGTARVFYPEAEPNRCTVALAVDVDPVALVRGKGAANAPQTLAQYVSDRPYVPNSFLSVALAQCFNTALAGNAREKAERVNEALPLSATLHALDCDGQEPLIRRLWEPLGYTVTIDGPVPLDERFPAWGASRLYTVTIAANVTVQNLLSHLYVLIPVLDNAKHYFFGEDEVEKLLRKGEGWLAAHPEKDLIARRYLRYRKPLADAALARLTDVEGLPDADEADATEQVKDAAEAKIETPLRLSDTRVQAALDAVRTLAPEARRVIDLGCGEGRTLYALHREFPRLEMLTGMDVAPYVLERASRRLNLNRMGERERAGLSLFQGSLVYRDARLSGYDCAFLMEVLEHIEPSRLPTVERVVFEFAHARRVVVTTPNAEYNSVWASLPAGKFRHADHRFEWTRTQFQNWGQSVAERFGYKIAFSGVGDEDPEGRGCPTQIAIFDDGGAHSVPCS